VNGRRLFGAPLSTLIDIYYPTTTMEFVLEIIVRIIFELLILGAGIYLRWCLKSLYCLATGKPIIPLKKCYNRFFSERDVSNSFSNGIINFILGLLVIGGVVLIIIQLVD
jgi:hypothetical protein